MRILKYIALVSVAGCVMVVGTNNRVEMFDRTSQDTEATENIRTGVGVAGSSSVMKEVIMGDPNTGKMDTVIMPIDTTHIKRKR